MLRPSCASFRSSLRFIMHSPAAMCSNSAPLGDESVPAHDLTYPPVRSVGGTPTTAMLMPSHSSPSADCHSSPRADSPPLLLLEGDSFYVSNGISRTLYKLHSSSGDNTSKSASKLMVEELYDIKGAKKTFVLRGEEDTGCRRGNKNLHFFPKTKTVLAAGTVNLGSEYYTFNLQELDSGDVETLGTGVTTWEASIVMSLYFSMYPRELSGHVIELGSGCGLGGILTQIASRAAMEDNIVLTEMNHGSRNWIESFAFTDCSSTILEQCRMNLDSMKSTALGYVPSHIQALDWNKVASSVDDENVTGCQQYQQYDVVIASDCAYRYADIEPLSRTIASLVHKDGGRLHFFGPLNRGALHDLIDMLRSRHGMQVDVECLEMERYRLMPRRQKKDEEISDYASSSAAKFLHVTARHASRCDRTSEDGDLSALD